MGLDTFPILQDETYLFTYKNSVFKLKLEYQNVSQQMKEAFIKVVSERAAHCQIEDVCRAVLYNIEREQPISAIQSEHFLIYPEIHRWPLANKVQFFIHRKQFNCHQDLILLKIFCKTDSASVPDQNPVEVLSSNNVNNQKLSHDTSQGKSRNETSSKKNGSASLLVDTNTNNKKAGSKVVSNRQTNGSVCDTPTVRLCTIVESVGPDSSNTRTTLPQLPCSQVSSHTVIGEQYSSHISHRKTGFTTETVIDDKSKHKKTMEPSLLGKYNHNGSREKTHQVNVMKKHNTRQSTQQSPKLVHIKFRNQLTLEEEKVPKNEIQYIHTIPEHLNTSDLQADHVSHSQSSQSSLCDGQANSDLHEVMSEGKKQVMSTRKTRSELQNKNVCNNLLHEGFRKNERRCVASQIKTRVTTSNPHQSMVRSVKTVIGSKGPTLVSKKKYSGGGNKSANTCDTIKGIMKHKGTCDDMKLHSSFEISDKDVVELSCDGRTLYESEKIVDHVRVTPVYPSMILRNRNRMQNISPIYSHSTNQYQVSRSQSAERDKARKLSGEVNRANIDYERMQCKGSGAVPAKKARGDSSQISVHNQRITTEFNFSDEESVSQSNCSIAPKKKILGLEGEEKIMLNINKELAQTTKSRGKPHSFDSLKQTATSYSDSSLSGETDTTSRSLQSKRRNRSISLELSSNRGSCVPDAVVEAHQHLLKAKDGVWLFWKS